MSFAKLGKFLLGVSVLLVIASITLFIVPGPRLSIDFAGGTLMELVLPEGKTKEDLDMALRTFQGEKEVGNVAIAQTKTGSLFVRLRDLSNEEHLALISHLNTELGTVQEQQFTTIGPTVGESLKRKSILALGIACIAIVAYIAMAFRKIPRRLNSWKFGIAAVAALLHDVILTTGIFVILSHTTTFEFDTLYVTALLTIIGYSVNDTIVIFDRIRENLFLQEGRVEFEKLVEMSFYQTFTRTINTALATLIMLGALFFLGAESIRWFALTLITGIVLGTYSSYFIAPPILMIWRKRD
jgi:preprotein translocase subunit SecF